MLNIGNQNNYSLLSYLGSKFTICHDVINYFPKHKIFVDAFGGAGNILINKPRSQVEIYNDVYTEVVSLFEVIRSKELCKVLFKAVKRTPYAEIEYINAYNHAERLIYAPILYDPIHILSEHDNEYSNYHSLYSDVIGAHGNAILDAIKNWAKKSNGKKIVIEQGPLTYQKLTQENPDWLDDRVKTFYGL